MQKRNPQIGERTFEDWVKLNKENPELFEKERLKTINSEIAKFPAKNQLKANQLQFVIDGVRRKYKNLPLVCTKELFSRSLEKQVENVENLTKTGTLLVSVNENAKFLLANFG